MSRGRRAGTRQLRGLKSLVHDAVSATVGLVGDGHDSTGRAVERAAAIVGLGEPARAANAARKVATDGVLGTVRGVNRLVEWVSDAGLDLAEGAAESDADPEIPLRADAMGTMPWVTDALIGAVNGVVGDHLSDRGNPLGLGFTLRVPASLAGNVRKTRRAFSGPSGARVVVLVHGLATTEWSWCLGADRLLGDPAANFGSLLERDGGYTPVYARYNTGRPVAQNARALAAALAELTRDVDVGELVIVGHSMGGLVARAATEIGAAEGAPWVARLTHLACLGTPHEGAPLERFGHALAGALHAVDLPGTRIPAAILRARSRGIQDLRHGRGEGPGAPGRLSSTAGGDVPADAAGLLPHVRYAFFAGSVADPAHPASVMLGDLLVPVASAEGGMAGSAAVRTGRFPGVLHHEIQVHPEVYAALRAFVIGETGAPDLVEP